MNYIGSKLKLSKFIKDTVYSVVEQDLSKYVFCDLFAGTGIIGRQFKQEVAQVISNDLEYYSYVLNRNYIANHKEIKDSPYYFKKLNDLKPLKGFIYYNYCLGGHGERQYFLDLNGEKIDAMRIQIENWKKEKEIDLDLYYFLLASLLECADKLANTASVYGAYLKSLKKTAQKELIIQPAIYSYTQQKHQVFNLDSNLLIKQIKGDILYLDPPYNARQYGSNYHILNTIARYDDFKPKGKTGLREYKRSKYCSIALVEKEFEDLIKNAQFKYIFLSYNNEGLMNLSQIKKIMSKYGKYDLAATNYQRFKADNSQNRIHKAEKTIEYLHILEK